MSSSSAASGTALSRTSIQPSTALERLQAGQAGQLVAFINSEFTPVIRESYRQQQQQLLAQQQSLSARIDTLKRQLEARKMALAVVEAAIPKFQAANAKQKEFIDKNNQPCYCDDTADHGPQLYSV